jgi:hypothetical protein
VIPKNTDEEFLDLDDGFTDHHIEDELGMEEDDFGISEEEYDEDELERRRVAYSDLKRSDKIFNNTYTMGYEHDEADEDGPNVMGGSSEIKIESGSAEFNMYDPEKYADHVDLKIVQRDIYNFIQSSSEVKAILGDEPEKRKFTKPEINNLFTALLTGLSYSAGQNVFISPIHILDSISSSVNMEYKKLFDMLTYENKELLLIELNNKYGFLDSIGKNYKMF